MTVSGISTHKVGVGADCPSAWQLPQVPQAPCRRGLLAQPGLRQRQRQVVLAQARRPLQQPGVATLGQQVVELARQPRRQRLGFDAAARRFGGFAVAMGYFGPLLAATMIDSQPRRTHVAVICCQTWWRVEGRVDACKALRRGAGAGAVAVGHAAEKLDRLGLELVGHAGAGQPLGRRFGRQVEPQRQVGLAHGTRRLRPARRGGLHPALQRGQLARSKPRPPPW